MHAGGGMGCFLLHELTRKERLGRKDRGCYACHRHPHFLKCPFSVTWELGEQVLHKEIPMSKSHQSLGPQTLLSPEARI